MSGERGGHSMPTTFVLMKEILARGVLALLSWHKYIVLVLAQEKQDSMPQHIIHVPLTDKVSIPYPSDSPPAGFKISMGTWRTSMPENSCLSVYGILAKKGREDLSTSKLIFKSLYMF